MIKIALRSMANRRFVCAENAGGEPLIANRDAIGEWEQFEVIVLEGSIPQPQPEPEPVPEPEPPPVPVGSVELVANIKTWLEGKGEDLSGPCGGFKITNATAWTLRSGGAGVLYKPSGNNCRERSVDIVCYQDGRAYDCLGDAGGANTPTWNQTDVDDVAGRWRAPNQP